MWNRIAVWLIRRSLAKADLTLKQRNEIVVHILGSLRAISLHGIITTNTEGEILIEGRSLNVEKVVQLREAARIALENKALKIVHQEVLYAAVVGGLHKGKSDLDLLFYRAAIWFGQQLEVQLKILAQQMDDNIIN